MSNAGTSFGAHGMTRQIMAGLESEIADHEVRESIQKIRRVTGQKDIAFAYPFGGTNSYNAETVRTVQESGTICGCASAPKMNTIRTPLFELNRIPAETFLF